eukprot:3753390-Ditylum_brightwellii.AAC.1
MGVIHWICFILTRGIPPVLNVMNSMNRNVSDEKLLQTGQYFNTLPYFLDYKDPKHEIGTTSKKAGLLRNPIDPEPENASASNNELQISHVIK